MEDPAVRDQHDWFGQRIRSNHYVEVARGLAGAVNIPADSSPSISLLLSSSAESRPAAEILSQPPESRRRKLLRENTATRPL
jgi:hypothetical protein